MYKFGQNFYTIIVKDWTFLFLLWGVILRREMLIILNFELGTSWKLVLAGEKLKITNKDMSVEYYKKQIIDLRARLDKEKEAKKKDNERYANMIKNTSLASSKATYRKSKVDRAASHDRAIESLKRQIESAKANLAREKAKKK